MALRIGRIRIRRKPDVALEVIAGKILAMVAMGPPAEGRIPLLHGFSAGLQHEYGIALITIAFLADQSLNHV